MNPFASKNAKPGATPGVFKSSTSHGIFGGLDSTRKRKHVVMREATNPFSGASSPKVKPQGSLLPSKPLSSNADPVTAARAPTVGLAPPKQVKLAVTDENSHAAAVAPPKRIPTVAPTSRQEKPALVVDEVARVLAAPSKDTEVEVARVPWDWSIKSRGRAVSKFPFEWVHEAKAALSNAVAECGSSSGTSLTSSNAAHRFAQGCLYWVHPTFPLPRSSLDMHENPNTDLALQRKAEWTVALKNVYEQLQHRHSDWFYVVFAEMTVLFFWEGEALRGLISRATRGLRHRLTQADVAFQEVTQSAKKEKRARATVGESLLEDTKAGADEQGAAPVLAGAHVDYKDTLRIPSYEEQQPVPLTTTTPRRLFEFILRDYTPPLMPDVPLIYAAAPFVNGGLKRLEVETAFNPGTASPGNERDGVAVLTIQGGIVLPHAMQAICSALRELQGQDCTAWWTSLPHSERLNAAAATVDRSNCTVTTPKVRFDAGRTFVTVATTAARVVASRCRDDRL